MKFSSSQALLLIVSLSTVAAFCGPQSLCSTQSQSNTVSHTKLNYAPNRQDDESRTKLNYVANRKNDDESRTDLYYAPRTTSEYETGFLIDEFKNAKGEITKPYRELEADKTVEKTETTTGKWFDFDNERKKLDRIFRSHEIFSDDRPSGLSDELPTAIGYAATLSVAGLASGMTVLAKAVAIGLEEGAKVSQKIECTFTEMAVEIRHTGVDVGAKSTQGFFYEIGEKMKEPSNIFGEKIKEPSHTFGEKMKEPEKIGLERQKIRHSSKKQPSGSNDFDNPLPELVQSLISQAESVVSSSPLRKKKKKVASVPAPTEGQYYSPFEACNILYHHEMDPMLDKPTALRLLLDKNFVPVGRSQLYRVFKQFKEGKITEARKWGQRGRPKKI